MASRHRAYSWLAPLLLRVLFAIAGEPRPSRFHAPFVAEPNLPPGWALRAAGRRLDSVPQSPGKVLYLVYTDSQFYNTRLEWVWNTWGSLVRDRVTFVGDTEYQGNISGVKVLTTRCPAHSHWEGACCKYAEAVRFAYEAMQRDEQIGWAFFTDDDSYVVTKAMDARLALEADPNNTGVMLSATYGCTTPNCSIGLCGGGGYAANRRAIVLTASAANLLEVQMENCKKCDRWADVSISQTFQAHSIELRELQGLYPWRLKKRDFDVFIGQGKHLQLHYIQKKEQFETLHRLFHKLSWSLDVHNDTQMIMQCACFQNTLACADNTDPTHLPWDVLDLAQAQVPTCWPPLPEVRWWMPTLVLGLPCAVIFLDSLCVLVSWCASPTWRRRLLGSASSGHAERVAKKFLDLRGDDV